MTSETQTPLSPTPNTGGKDRFRIKGNRRNSILLGTAVLVLSLALGYPLYVNAVSHESTDNAFIEAHVVSMSPRVAGHVARVLVADNQMVKKGQLLAEIDSRDFQVALAIAMARMQSAKAAVNEAAALVSAAHNTLAQKDAELTSQHTGLAQVRAEVAEVKAGYDRDENDLGRIRRIVEAGAVSRQEFDHAKAQEAMAKAKLNSAQRHVDTQSAKITQAQATVKTAGDELRQTYALMEMRTAELHEAESEVERSRLNLSYTRITAPCDGHVTKKSIEPGAYVQVGQKLFSIVSQEVWVVANFKETQVSDIRPGQPVDIEVDSYPDATFKGHVDSIQRGTGSRFTLLPPENATGNFIKVVQRVPVKIVLDDQRAQSEFVLAPGMSVIPRVNISGDTEINTLRAESTLSQQPAVQ